MDQQCKKSFKEVKKDLAILIHDLSQAEGHLIDIEEKDMKLCLELPLLSSIAQKMAKYSDLLLEYCKGRCEE